MFDGDAGRANYPAVGDRLENLDTLRGVAALLVVLHHVGLRAGIEWFFAGYLCVDLFFMISGFVMDRVYRPRFAAGMTAFQFARKRLSRLHPVIAIGIAAGLIVALLNGDAVPETIGQYVAQLLFIPVFGSPENSIYPLNGVQWSLFFELLANFAHVALIWHLSRRHLVWAVGVSLLALIAASFYFDMLSLGDRGFNFLGGVPRVMFSYTLGVLIHRLSLERRLPVVPVNPYVLGALLAGSVVALSLIRPWSGWWLDLLAVVTIFPAILIAGLAAPRRSARAALWLGGISYPLYALHIPVLDIVTKLEIPALLALPMALGAAAVVDAILNKPGPRSDVGQLVKSPQPQ